jgi:enamine deaminase RidA (YjgF/YER057c/UK114 family)
MSHQRQLISSGSPWEAMAGYSRAVVEGNLIFVSGTVGVDPKTQKLPAGATAQANQALDIIEAALREAQASLLDVARVRVYVPNRADVPAVSAVLKARLGLVKPANTTVCAPLAVEEALVEIEVTAVRSKSPIADGG